MPVRSLFYGLCRVYIKTEIPDDHICGLGLFYKLQLHIGIFRKNIPHGRPAGIELCVGGFAAQDNRYAGSVCLDPIIAFYKIF
jgi:hypothetical protein